jgi:diadenosine tetraphosphatase ApaH/serine/threonine PP2A family protein phosphatase
MPPLALVERAREYCLGQLGDELAQELAGLPERQEIEGVLFCHASPRSDMDGFSPRASERDDELIGDEEQTVIVFGHTHLQFQREARGRLLVNPGSVGMPFDGDRRAAYALWRGGRDFELRRVEYDSAAYALELRSRMARALGDTVDTLVRRIEQAALVD